MNSVEKLKFIAKSPYIFYFSILSYLKFRFTKMKDLLCSKLYTERNSFHNVFCPSKTNYFTDSHTLTTVIAHTHK